MAYFGSVTYPCIPCSKYVKWYLIWCRYIGRPHLGMRFEAIKLLEPSHVDMLCRMYNIDDGLVVREVYNAFLKVLFFPCAYGNYLAIEPQVSKGSNAEICGIQKGDLIECIKGKCISTTIEVGLLMS